MTQRKEGLQTVSPEMSELQDRLLKLRQKARQTRIDAGLPVDIRETPKGQAVIRHLRAQFDDPAAAAASRPSSQSLRQIRKQLPPHLGWGSLSPERIGQLSKYDLSRSHPSTPQKPTDNQKNTPQTKGLSQRDEPSNVRLTELFQKEECDNSPNPTIEGEGIALTSPLCTPEISLSPPPSDSISLPAGQDASSASPEAEAHVKIFGHVLDGIHRCKRDGAGRIWLLLRYMDRETGEGRVLLRDARHKIAHPTGELKCLSKKRLQQLIRQGEGVFWHKSKDGRYLYYHSEARVAAAIGLQTIRGFALQIPIQDLLQPIRHVRALFHDAFHSSRQEGFGNPITRRVMQARGMADGRTQRQYESLRGMHKRSEFAVIETYSKAAWERAKYEDQDERVGGPAFIFVDFKGILGENKERYKRPKGRRHWHNIYIMRQIGNAYAGSLTTAKRGRHWTSKKLRHLYVSMQTFTGSAGEGGRPEEELPWCGRYYYESDKKLDRSLRRESGEGEDLELRPRYYPQPDQDLDWNSDQEKGERVLSSESFYWQERFFVF